MAQSTIQFNSYFTNKYPNKIPATSTKEIVIQKAAVEKVTEILLMMRNNTTKETKRTPLMKAKAS